MFLLCVPFSYSYLFSYSILFYGFSPLASHFKFLFLCPLLSFPFSMVHHRVSSSHRGGRRGKSTPQTHLEAQQPSTSQPQAQAISHYSMACFMGAIPKEVHGTILEVEEEVHYNHKFIPYYHVDREMRNWIPTSTQSCQTSYIQFVNLYWRIETLMGRGLIK